MAGFYINLTEDELQKEEWRDVPEFEGYYKVSNYGRIKRIVGGGCSRPEKILKIASYKDGYHVIHLSADKRKGRRLVHRLVAGAFIGPCPPKYQVNHIDGIKAHNHVSNLEYCTAKENQQHAARLGLTAIGDRNGSRKHPERLRRGDQHPFRLHPEKAARGERQHSAKLTEEKVRQIRKEYAAGGITREKLATRYSITPGLIGHVIKRRIWKHVD